MTESTENYNTPTMAERKSPQVTVTLSDKTLEEFQLAANWKGVTLATFIRYTLEQYHESPDFASLLQRVKEEQGNE